MTHVEYFEADDGTMFDDEFDCYQYELELRAKTLTTDLFFFDSHHNALPLTRLGYEDSYYVCVNTEEASEYLNDLAGFTGQCPPWGSNNEPRPGKWVYVEGGPVGWLEFGELEDFYNTCEAVFNSVP